MHAAGIACSQRLGDLVAGHVGERRVGGEAHILLGAALHPGGDEEGDHVAHQNPHGGGPSYSSPIWPFTMPGSSTLAVTPGPAQRRARPYIQVVTASLAVW
jgi:hypothetical protein